MAYILGYIYADGNLEDASYIRAKYLRITSIDLSTLREIKNALSAKHKIIKIPPKIIWGVGRLKNQKYLSKSKYLLRIGDHNLYNSLIKKGLCPRKSLTITLPPVPIKYLSDFIRGYFDGDGSVWFSKIEKRLNVVFCCGSFKFLYKLSSLLYNYAGLKAARVVKGNRSFQIKYSSLDSLKLFDFMYQNKQALFMKRKHRIFTLFMVKILPFLPKISKQFKV